MASESIEKLVARRRYPQLEKRASEYIESDDWKKFLANIRRTSSKGKARDAVVHLLKGTLSPRSEPMPLRGQWRFLQSRLRTDTPTFWT